MKKVMYLFSVLIILGGVALLCYPSFANYFNQRYIREEIITYKKQINSFSNEKIERLIQLANQYNSMLPGSYPADPFSGDNITDFTGTDYEDFFMVKDGEIIGYVEAPQADIYLPVYYGTTEEVLQKGAGLVSNTSLPVGGTGTHAVVSAHTGLASKKFFTNLPNMKEGDTFFIHVLNYNLAYKVDQIKEVLPHETDDLQIEKDKDYVTLLTCTPFGVNSHRLLVRGVRTEYDFEKEKDKDKDKDENSTVIPTPKEEKDTTSWMLVITVFIITVLLLLYTKFIIFLIKRIRKKKPNSKEKVESIKQSTKEEIEATKTKYKRRN